MSKDYIWYLKDLKNVTKNGCKVFTTFSCGGGSSMGYKLAGYEVVGNCEIDPKINDMYVKNHHPKYNFMMGVQDFYKEENLKNIPEELYGIDVLDGSPPCFVAGTKVRTKNGYKNIEDIVVGDEVYTHKGRFRSVYETMEKTSDDVYMIKAQGVLPIYATGEHPFYVRTMKRGGKYWKREFKEPCWKKVRELHIEKNRSGCIREQDYIGFPVETTEVLPEWSGIEYEHNIYGKKKEIKIKKQIDVSDEKFWRLVGRYIGDGWRRKGRKEVYIRCAKDEKEELEKIIAYAGFTFVCTEEKTTYKYCISSVELFAFLEQFGDGVSNKHLTNDVLCLPMNLLKAFFEGYMSADGSVDKRNGKCRLSSVSYELVLGMQAVIAKLYHSATTITIKDNSKTPIEGRAVKTHIAYDLAFFKEKRKQKHAIYEDGYLWVPFRELKKVDGSFAVYNMSVSEDESYNVFNLAVHNCSTFSMAGGREKYWGKEKHFREGQAKQVLDDLFFEFLNVAELLKPKVIIAENVKGLIGGNAKGYVNLIFKRLDELGYKTQLFLLNGATMGVPQKRERVFFVARRKELDLPDIKMSFNEKPILYGEFASDEYKPFNKESMTAKRWEKRAPIDNCLGDTVKRTENGKLSGFTAAYLKKDRVCPTVTAGGGMLRFDKPGYPIDKDIIMMQSFPQDYDFNGNDATYVCGMSVPPLMMKGVASEVYKQWLSKL